VGVREWWAVPAVRWVVIRPALRSTRVWSLAEAREMPVRRASWVVLAVAVRERSTAARVRPRSSARASMSTSSADGRSAQG
jgi:hypothetical protein